VHKDRVKFVMQKLNFPTYTFKVKNAEDGSLLIYDTLRKKYVKLTPEEWVRQHAIKYLNKEKGFSLSLMEAEKKITINTTTKRFDLVCKNNKGETLLLLECKSPNVKLTQATFDQILRYNNVLKAHYIWITNGINHFIFKLDYENNTYQPTKDIAF
jgi:hypothetical protein